MRTPGFTASTALYRTSSNYVGAASGSDLLTRGIAGGAAWDLTLGTSTTLQTGGFPFLYPCGGLGQDCCRAPYQNIPAFGPLVGCDKGLGCDIATNKCVSPCGGAGQPCCDGPETRAVKWTAEGYIYSPRSPDLRELCDAGACEKQSHRCFGCGTQDGATCCPPDAAQISARCIGDHLECAFDSNAAISGTCRACGKPGKPPCEQGCDAGLSIRNGLCYACGADGQPPCDNTGCNAGLGVLNNLCRVCGGLGQVRCDSGCNGGRNLLNNLCADCGSSFQPPCDSGCSPGTVPMRGVCRLCGYEGLPPCANGACAYTESVAGGVCRVCGAKGQIQCDRGCDPGLLVKNGRCTTPQDPTPEYCSNVGESCVPDNQPGKHCCQNPGAHERCVVGTCKACLLHNEECVDGGTQLCCSPEDGGCVLDVASGKLVCGIPG